ncbi:MAG: bifunctional UDP-N-acetylglucosamine diphosphorylase/glucosamine-1-phosphate N-acetyltransferase GlmU [Chloroflexi bacterium]|nr:bifunctional UDP-N-acetylglucosamine diphosphorylase/glucosamine-1-phosphate N-acetyltransferase GlmU [Chloroflexota bacterium]
MTQDTPDTPGSSPASQSDDPPSRQRRERCAAIVLAAGKGTRMRSSRHKVLHPVAGKPMIWHVLTALREAGIPAERTVVVVGDSAAEVQSTIDASFGAGTYSFAYQAEQRGTGHATLQARAYVLTDADTVVVAYGDTPLLQECTVTRLLQQHEAGRTPVTLVSGRLDEPQGYGRILRDAGGSIAGIVEDRDATPDQRTIREVNSGFCAFDAAWLWRHLPHVSPAPNGELYLTTLAEVAARSGGVQALIVDNVDEVLGVNTRVQLAAAEATLRGRITTQLMLAGVTIQHPASTYVDAGVVVRNDTVLLANTHLTGNTSIGSQCVIGPNAIVGDSTIGDRCRIVCSVLDRATLEAEVTVGPFAHLRPGTRCGRAVEVGTGSEIKASSLGAGTKMHHFGYLGDATVGEHVNVGAGTVTCNYDGERKHATEIGDGAFLGSGTLLVAPVHVGAAALTGAGAVVTRDVAATTTVVGVPARPLERGRRRGAGSSEAESPAGSR